MRLVAPAFLLGALPTAAAAAEDSLGIEVDLFELHLGRGDDHLLLDSTLTAGGGDDQLLVKLAGGSDTRTNFDDIEIQALYSRSVAPAVALHMGARHDFRAGTDLTHGVTGLTIEPLPGVEAEHYFYLSEHGKLTGGGQLVTSWNLTPRLAMEPRLGIGWSAQRIAAEELGHGLTDVEASFRLRRSLGGNADVYTGIIHERLLGSTRTIAVAAGEPARVTRAILGFGLSF